MEQKNDKKIDKSKESLSHKAGDKLERAGEKLTKAGFPKAGNAIYKTGNKLEHSNDE